MNKTHNKADKPSRAYLEARLIDLLDGVLSEAEIASLKITVEAHKDLAAEFEFIISNSDLYKMPETVSKVWSSKSSKDLAAISRIEKAMDNEWYWDKALPTIKGMIYRVILPAIAASFFMFFQWGSTYVSPVQETLDLSSLSGQTDLQSFEQHLNSYAGIEELDVLIENLQEKNGSQTNQ